MTRPLCGIFVGGAGKRMGGLPKGLLPCEPGGEAIVRRLERHARTLGLDVVLVGQHAAYEHLGLPFVADQPADLGPLGGLCALLAWSGDRDALALACDMPFVTAATLQKLLSLDAVEVDVVAAQTGPHAPLETFLARYRPSARPVLEEHARRSNRRMQDVFQTLRVKKWLLPEEDLAACQDWDRVEEMPPVLRAEIPTNRGT